MSRKALIYLAVAVVAVVTIGGFGVKYYTDNKNPVHQNENDTTVSQSDESDDSEEGVVGEYDNDVKSYTGKDTKSDEPTSAKKADAKGIVLNSDNKVLVQTDSTRSDVIKSAMADWNHALGENVFLPAKDNSRVDLLIQDDETKVPVNLFNDANSEDDGKKNAKYIQTVVNTNDHRMMILDDVAKHSNASGYGMDSNDDGDVKEDIKSSLGHAIGVDYEDNVVLDKLDSEEGRKELRTKFQQSESHHSNQKLYNKGISTDTKGTKEMGKKDNKTYATWTNYRDNIEHLPIFDGYRDELLNIIDEPHEPLVGEDATTQGQLIDETLQSTFRAMDDIDEGDESDNGVYEGVPDREKDGRKTIANTDSTMGDDFKEYLKGNKGNGDE